MDLRTGLELQKRSPKHRIKSLIKERFGGACAYCGCVPKVLTLDHIMARSKGGYDVRSNLVAVCRRCNKSKGSRPLWEWWQSSPWWCEDRAHQISTTVLVCKVKIITESI
jgi:5-methylcytosine-specific restriction endonuclease McrA